MDVTTPHFSVIIPAYNAAGTIAASVLSALRQEGLAGGAVEVIVVDDCSTDSTGSIIALLADDHPGLRPARTPSNGGPGVARNVGMDMARGEWLLFLDGDDYLTPDALATLENYLTQFTVTTVPHAVGFDWSFKQSSGTGCRCDQRAFALLQDDMLRRYLRLQMDGSVIYTAVRRDLVATHRLRFAPGYHEDVDFIFKIYWLAGRIGYLDHVLYLKTERADSIVNTISIRHLEGFMRAWAEIATFIAATAPVRWYAMQPDWQRGLTAVIATRLREILRRMTSAADAAPLYRALHQLAAAMPAPPAYAGSQPWSQYEQITARFLTQLAEPAPDFLAAADKLTVFLKDVVTRTWSCSDLHHSVFLAPNQVRTCCKRFFVEGEMRGDVPLLDSPNQAVTIDTILAAKRNLYISINRGEPTPCDGCFFMEFKDWGSLAQLDIRYLSLEYHSVCNLKCAYCCETYYNGMAPQYDVENLVYQMLENHVLDACHTIVWGGGEPVVDKHFSTLIEKLAERMPKVEQRVLTNSVKHSEIVERLLSTGQVAVTTSIDAGNADTFKLVRGKAKLHNVIATLKKYAAVAPERVTIKYIFTAQNNSLAEVRGFVDLMTGNALTECNFQISSDFKEEDVSPKVALSMIVMYGLLSRAEAQVVFFDDLLRHRLSDILAGHEAAIRSELAIQGLGDILADPDRYPAVAIWGAGWQARYLLERTAFFKRVPVSFFVDQTPSKIGTTYFDRPVKAPQVLTETGLPVIIAATQGFPAIYRNYLALGMNPDRLVRQLIL